MSSDLHPYTRTCRRSPLRYRTLTVLAAALFAGAARADEPSRPPAQTSRPVRTAALLDFDRSPVGALLEARLLKGPRLTWLDRENIDKVLKEQQLQTLFSPDGVARRAALGKLLKADLLVLLRTIEDRGGAHRKSIELVVSETRRGLRLAQRTALLSGDAEAVAADFEQTVNDAVRKQEEEVKEVWAVPPFLNDDLTYQYDYLRSPYARVIDRLVLERPGALVVELAEARALARENALAEDGGALERQLPLYFLGDYRNEGDWDERRVRLGLRLMRGEKQLGEILKTVRRAEDVPEALRRAAADLVAKLGGKEPPRFDRDAEARQLARRGSAFLRLGSWEEALALIEASLLLKPDQPGMHRDGVITCGMLAGLLWRPPGTEVKPCTQALYAYRRGLTHLEASLRAQGDRDPHQPVGQRTFVDEFVTATSVLWSYPARAPDLRDLYAEVRKEHRDTFLRLTRLRAEGGWGDEERFLSTAVIALPVGDQYHVIFAAIIELKKLPGARARTVRLAPYLYGVNSFDQPEFAGLLDRLSAAPEQEIRAAADDLKKQIAAFKAANAHAAAAGPRPLKPTAGPAEVVFRPVTLSWEDPSTGAKGVLARLSGCLPAGDRRDVVWGTESVYLMKEKGKLTRVWSAEWITDVCFDGRYVWATARRHLQPPLLHVIDPQTGKGAEFTAGDGLPAPAAADLPDRFTGQFLLLAPLGPGKVCVAGWFGRTWIGVAVFDPAEGKSVRVFHEAREAPDPQDREQWRRTTVAFEPAYLFTLSGKGDPAGKTEQRVLLGRKSTNPYLEDSPLLIDPGNRSVEVLPKVLWAFLSNRQIAASGGAVYFVEVNRPSFTRLQLARIGFPGLKKEAVLVDVPQGWPEIEGDRIHIVGKQWWVGNLSEQKGRVLAGKLPWFFMNQFSLRGQINPDMRVSEEDGAHTLEALCRSSHYGLLVVVQHVRKTPTRSIDSEILQVEFPKPADGK